MWKLILELKRSYHIISFYFQILFSVFIRWIRIEKIWAIRFSIEHLFRSSCLLQNGGEQRSIQFFILCFWDSVRSLSRKTHFVFIFFSLQLRSVFVSISISFSNLIQFHFLFLFNFVSFFNYVLRLISICFIWI